MAMLIRLTISFISLLLSITTLYSQTNLDSLFAIWNDTVQHDTTRAIAFTDYIYDGNFNTNLDTALALTSKLYQFTETANYKRGTVEALNLIGYTYFRTGKYPQALDNYQKGLKVADSIGYRIGRAQILLKIGHIYHDNGDMSSALDYYQQCLKIFQDNEHLLGIRSVYNEYGNIYFVKNDPSSALVYFQKALAIGDLLHDENSKSAIYLNIGMLYVDQADYENALDNFNKGLALYSKANDKLGIAAGLSSLAMVYSAQGDNTKALVYLKQSLTISEEINDVQGIADILLSMGEIFIDQTQHKKSIEACTKSLGLSVELDDVDGQEAACNCLYRAYKGAGDLKNAIYYLETETKLLDSLSSIETIKKLQQMEFAKKVLQDSIANAEKERLVALAYQQEIHRKEKSRNISIGIGSLVLLLAGGLYSRLRYIRSSKAVLQIEKDRSENLLLNILPAEIAQELKEKGKADARDFEMVSILFTDFKSFTELSATLSATELVEEINHCFEAFDGIMETFHVEKIKTIGDAYMAAGGLPVPTHDSVKKTVLAALAMQSFIIARKQEQLSKGRPFFEMRVGIHTGPVVAGIVGVKKFQYDIWGDTVNTASRLESSGEVDYVNISQSTYEILYAEPDLVFERRGKIDVKGKGELEMYYVQLKS